MDGSLKGSAVKIAFIYDAVYPWIKGGGEKTLYELAVALRDRGHEVHFFGMHCWDGPRDVIREGLHYHALSPKMPLYGRSGKRTMFQALRFAAGVLLRLPRYKLAEFDVIDIHAFPYLSVPPFWIVRNLTARRSAWVVTWLEVWGSGYWRRYLGRAGIFGTLAERLTARLGPHHLCISPTTASRLQNLLGVPAEETTVIPRGFSPANSSPSEVREPAKVVVANRLLDYKRTELIIRAWAEVVARIPLARLHVIGDGPERAACEQLAATSPAAESIRFLGQLDRHECVLKEIASAALLLQPSVREGQSTVVLEGMAAGTPVLAAEGPETAVADFLPQHPQRHLTLLPIEAGAAEWANRIVRLLGDPSLLKQMAECGRSQVAAFNWRDVIAPRVEELYRDLAAS